MRSGKALTAIEQTKRRGFITVEITHPKTFLCRELKERIKLAIKINEENKRISQHLAKTKPMLPP